MWIFTKHGFISIVQHNSIADHFQVKSREPGPLKVLWPEHEIEVIEWADYRYRITIPKNEVVPVLVGAVEDILYTSFKNECERDSKYYSVLTRVWSLMYNYQKNVLASPSARDRIWFHGD